MLNKAFFILVICFTFVWSQEWTRQGVIPAPEPDLNVGGIGEMISNVDLDNDGRMDVYFVSHNWTDATSEFTPRLYKMEYNGSEWEIVWKTEYIIWRINTWPALTIGDLDNDGRPELIYGPANWTDPTENPNPERLLIFEYPDDGSDNMGVDDGFGGWLPNSTFTIASEDNLNLRPFRWLTNDIDGDGTDELIFCDRVATSSLWSFGVLSVDDIPDDGAGTETWTVEANGPSVSLDPVENKWDIAVLNSTIYLFDEIEMSRVTWNGSAYEALPGQNFNLDGRGSWKSAQVFDVDFNGAEEIVVGSWLNNDADGDGFSDPHNIYVLEEDGDSLKATVVATIDTAMYGLARIYGSAIGDIDNNGKTDYVFGTRGSTPNGLIFRLEYVGIQDQVADPANWELSVIDSNYATGGRWDLLEIVNVDADLNNEVLYTTSVPDNDGSVVNVVIMDLSSTRIPGPWQKVDLAYTFDGLFGDTTGLGSAGVRGGHGIAVDNQDRVWAASYYDSYIRVFNSDGSVAFDIDTVRLDPDTLRLSLPTGIAKDNNGNMIVSTGASGTTNMFLLDGNTGEYIAHINFNEERDLTGEVSNSQGAAMVDDEGFVTFAWTFLDDGPIVQIDAATGFDYANVSTIDQTLLEDLPGFCRGSYISPDGMTFIPGDLTGGPHKLPIYTTTDFITWNLTDSIKYDNTTADIFSTQTVTLDRAADGKVWVSHTNTSDYSDLIWFDFSNSTYGVVSLPGGGVRGVAFSSDGQSAYYADWTNGVYKLSGNFVVTNLEENGERIIPDAFSLEQNYPNPFNPTTNITFNISEANKTTLKIYNILGQEVYTLVSQKLMPGSYSYTFDASKLASGTYIYKLKSGDNVQSKKMVLMK